MHHNDKGVRNRYISASVKITITLKPKKNKVVNLKSWENKTLKVTWKKDTKCAGYELHYSALKKFTKPMAINISKNKTTSYKIRKLSKGKKYYVRVRPYQNVKVNGKAKKLYGDWSTVRLYRNNTTGIKGKKIFMKRILINTVLIIAFSIIMSCKADASVLEDNIESLIKWCKANGGFTESPDGDSTTDWYIFGASRYGYNFNYKEYLNNLEEYIKENGLDSEKATEYHRLSLVVLSLGGNPCSFAGINLIKDGVYGRGKDNPLDEQGINGLIFGLLALDSNDYSVPEDSQYTREKIVEDILSRQLSDGGFSLYGEEADSDITAMVIQALAPYYLEDRGINVKHNVDRALASLSKMQLEDGGFESGGIANSESCVQVITALCSVGINPYKEESFIKNGCSVPDALMEYRREDGGFSHTHEGESDWMAGSQALNGLTALYRYENGMESLYDMKNNSENLNVYKDNKTIYYAGVAVLVCILASGVAVYGKIRKKKVLHS